MTEKKIDVATIEPTPSMMRIAEYIKALQSKYQLLEDAERLRQQMSGSAGMTPLTAPSRGLAAPSANVGGAVC